MTSSTIMKTKQDLRATCASCQYENWNKTTHLQCKACNGQNWAPRQKKVWPIKPQPDLVTFLRNKK